MDELDVNVLLDLSELLVELSDIGRPEQTKIALILSILVVDFKNEAIDSYWAHNNKL